MRERVDLVAHEVDDLAVAERRAAPNRGREKRAAAELHGPTHKAFGALEDEAQAEFARDLLALAAEHNTSGTEALRVPSEYLEVVAVKA